MRCKEKTGFLMLRQCDNVADAPCCFCGKEVCREHGYPLTKEQVAMYAVGSDIVEPQACQECLRQRMAGTTDPQYDQPLSGRQRQSNYSYDDPYRPYPYGGYHAYYWSTGFNHRDRSVFDRTAADTTSAADGEMTDPLES